MAVHRRPLYSRTDEHEQGKSPWFLLIKAARTQEGLSDTGGSELPRRQLSVPSSTVKAGLGEPSEIVASPDQALCPGDMSIWSCQTARGPGAGWQQSIPACTLSTSLCRWPRSHSQGGSRAEPCKLIPRLSTPTAVQREGGTSAAESLVFRRCPPSWTDYSALSRTTNAPRSMGRKGLGTCRPPEVGQDRGTPTGPEGTQDGV